jgi:hypothetical protein
MSIRQLALTAARYGSQSHRQLVEPDFGPTMVNMGPTTAHSHTQLTQRDAIKLDVPSLQTWSLSRLIGSDWLAVSDGLATKASPGGAEVLAFRYAWFVVCYP